jgi:dolichyl-phosphate-mannose--protein O-mannosyl transferase
MLSKSFAVCLAICALIITFITIFPTYFGTEYGKQSLELAKWTAAKDFKEFCRDEFV